MTVDENGREEGVDYSGQVWTVAGDSHAELIDELDDPSTDLKIFRYVATDRGWNRKSPPIDVDYKTGLNRRLYRKESFVHGELRSVELFDATNTGADGWPAYTDLIVREDMTYVRDGIGFARSRTTTITWYLESGDAHETQKTLHKMYSPLESQKEGITRRGNIIDQLSLVVGSIMIQVLPTNETYPDAQAKLEVGRMWMQQNKLALDMFVQASKRDIVGIVKHATESWLDVVIDVHGTKIRDLIINEVDIWGIAASV